MADLRRPGPRLVDALRRRICARWLRDRGGDHRASVLLAGTGRSGTTWLANVINHRNDHRLLFEPFHPGRVPLCSHFPHRKYLRPDDEGREWLEPVRTVLEGQVRGPWVDGQNRRLVARRRLIKTTRAMLFLGWLRAHFPEVPLVLLLRHPCAVALSRRAKGWGTNLEGFLSQEALVEDHLAPFADAMRAAETELEKSVFLWCVDAYVPLRQLGPGQLHVILFEDLHLRPEAELERLFGYLGLPGGAGALREIDRPSLQSRPDSAIVAGRDVVRDWQGRVTPEEAARALEIVASFGLGGIYGPDGLPERGAAERCFGPRPGDGTPARPGNPKGPGGPGRSGTPGSPGAGGRDRSGGTRGGAGCGP